MARPTKQGIDYFPLDCIPDAKIELFIADAGIDAFGILIFVWQMIYRSEGYYIEYSRDLVLLLRKHTLSEPETIETAISKAVDRGLFDEKTFKNHSILTSSGIQKRFFQIAKKKKQVMVYSDYLLIDISEYENIVLVDGNPIDSGGKPPKKSKGKVKESKKEKLYEFLKSKISENGFSKHQDKIVEFFEYRMMKPKDKQYKTEKGINGLLRECKKCQEIYADLNECLDVTMEREWLTPDPEYLEGKVKTIKGKSGKQKPKASYPI